jgi:hypothetical protein
MTGPLNSAMAPEPKAYARASISSSQPWRGIGTVIGLIGLVMAVAASNHWIAASFQPPALAILLIGLVLQVIGFVKQMLWRRANPISQYTQGNFR